MAEILCCTPFAGSSARVIHDAAGRVLRRFDPSVLAGGGPILWDARDGLGRALPSGVYFLQQSGRPVTRFVVLR